jgi:hypothetical protein
MIEFLKKIKSPIFIAFFLAELYVPVLWSYDILDWAVKKRFGISGLYFSTLYTALEVVLLP